MVLHVVLTHGDIRKLVRAAVGMDSVEVWSSGVHTSNYQVGAYVPLIPMRQHVVKGPFIHTSTCIHTYVRTYVHTHASMSYLYKYCLSILRAVATLG